MTFFVEYEQRAYEPSDIGQHLPRLFDEASIDDVHVIELGVRTGNSTAAFLAAAEQQRGHVWSVDINSPRVPLHWFASDLWTPLVGNDLELAGELPNYVDVLFIDTSHRYDQTKAELELYAPKVKPGGRILLHDTELEHPEAESPGDPAFPVATALREWAAESGAVVEWVSGCNGLGVVYIGGEL